MLRRQVLQRKAAKFQLFSFSYFVFGFGDDAGGTHAAHHPQLAFARPRGAGNRVGVDRVLRQPGHHGHFCDAQFVQCFAKVHQRCCGHAVSPLTQEYLVQVKVEDLVFVQTPFQLHGQQRFLDLAFGRAPRGQEKGARHLLRQCGCTLRHTAGQVGDGRAHHTAPADAAVLVELGVFYRQHCVTQPLGDFVHRYIQAPFGAELRNLGAVGGEHLHVLARFVFGSFVGGRQVPAVPQHGGTHHHQGHQQHGTDAEQQRGQQHQAPLASA